MDRPRSKTTASGYRTAVLLAMAVVVAVMVRQPAKALALEALSGLGGIGAAVGLSYADRARGVEQEGPGMFTHVYIEPTAYHHFKETGEFREGTTFALEVHRPAGNVSIARHGLFEGERIAVHASVKDSSRFDGGWAYFDVDGEGVGSVDRSGACASCHLEHGAIDNVFVQFYPVLRDLGEGEAARR